MRSWVLAAAVMLLGAAVPQVGSAAGGDAVAGHAVAQTWCASCHAIEARPTVASDQAPGFVVIANRAGVTADGLRAFLTAPHGRMPNLSLSRADIENAVAYLLSLKGK